MDASPDIVVASSTGRRLLAVEVKLTGDLDAGSLQMAEYMDGLRYPVGVVIVGRELTILRRDFARGVIATVGRFSTEGVSALTPPSAGPDAGHVFAGHVQHWLESLPQSGAINDIPEPLSGAIAEWVMPQVEMGEVRSAGPRYSVARAG